MTDPTPPETIRTLAARLPTWPAAGYPVVVGHGAWERLGELLPAPRHGVAIVSDEQVWECWGERLLETLAPLEADVAHYTFPAGERHKRRRTKRAVEDRLLAHPWGRDVVILGLGGGVVTDLAGFVAATYLRGVRYVSLPTSLLAMVDAALGGKTGVDTAHGKNLVGAFHQPAAVLADLRTLDTLPAGELDNGLAETVKHAMIADAALLDTLLEGRDALRRLDPAVTLDVVARSIGVKLDTVAADEQDHGVRQALNFGHTIGHALERVTDYGLNHGHAVAIGMCVEADAAARAGLLAGEARDRLLQVLTELGLPTRLPAGVDRSALEDGLLVDKKNRRGEVRFALPAAVGRIASFDGQYATTLPPDALQRALEART